MNALVSYVSIAVFALVPPLLLGLRLRRRRPSWWAVVPTLIVVGWASCLSATAFHFEALGDQIARFENPPAELIDRWSSDGGPKVLALVFGWAIAGICSIAWFLVLGLVSRKRSRMPASDKLEIRILHRDAILAPNDRE